MSEVIETESPRLKEGIHSETKISYEHTLSYNVICTTSFYVFTHLAAYFLFFLLETI